MSSSISSSNKQQSSMNTMSILMINPLILFVQMLSIAIYHPSNAFIPSTFKRPKRSTFHISKSPAPTSEVEETLEADVVIIGSGIGGLTAGAILNTLYNKKVVVLESHYLPGGCAHAFNRTDPISKRSYTFDSGPSILLGCSSKAFPNPLQQVLNAVGQKVEWIRYYGWGMIEPSKEWKLELGVAGKFEAGPLREYASNASQALVEFKEVCAITRPLLSGLNIPAVAMRSDNWNIVPLLFKYPKPFLSILAQGEAVLGTFAPYMDGPIYTITDAWLRDYLDALAFSLSGLSANRTSAAAMAFVLYDCHEREDAVLDYPRGGLGSVIDALIRGVTQGDRKSRVCLNAHVQSIDFSTEGKAVRATGVTLKNGTSVRARDGVICNAPIWSLQKLLQNSSVVVKELMGYSDATKAATPNVSWNTNRTDATTSLDMQYRHAASNTPNKSYMQTLNEAEMTGSFLHLHVVLNSTGLDLANLQPHYTVMSRSLSGSTEPEDGPCGPLNMIALSNPCILDPTLAPEGCIILHAYGAANEPYEIWEGMDRFSSAYKDFKTQRAQVLYQAIQSIIPSYKQRILYEIIGTPLTHERFLRRPRGTYGAATEDYLSNGKTPISNLQLCGDGVFPGVGIPAVALSGCSAANAMVGLWDHWKVLDLLEKDGSLL